MPIALAVVSQAEMPAAFLYAERCARERASVGKAFILLPNRRAAYSQRHASLRQMQHSPPCLSVEHNTRACLLDRGLPCKLVSEAKCLQARLAEMTAAALRTAERCRGVRA